MLHESVLRAREWVSGLCGNRVLASDGEVAAPTVLAKTMTGAQSPSVKYAALCDA